MILMFSCKQRLWTWTVTVKNSFKNVIVKNIEKGRMDKLDLH